MKSEKSEKKEKQNKKHVNRRKDVEIYRNECLLVVLN